MTLLVHARDGAGPLLLILDEGEPLPDYCDFVVEKVETFATHDDAMAAYDVALKALAKRLREEAKAAHDRAAGKGQGVVEARNSKGL